MVCSVEVDALGLEWLVRRVKAIAEADAGNRDAVGKGISDVIRTSALRDLGCPIPVGN
jgi:hypothetical protein